MSIPRVSTGTPIRTLTVVGRTIGLPFRIDAVAALNRHRHDRHLRLERHQERAALERQQRAGPAARAFRECQKRIALPQRRGSLLDGGHRLLTAGAVDRHESADLKRLAEQRQLRQLPLEQHVQPRMERLKQDRRIDVALMIAAEHHGLAGAQMLAPGHAVRMPASDVPMATPQCPSTYNRLFQRNVSASAMPMGAAIATYRETAT